MLFYEDDPNGYRVELHDHVDVRIDGHEFEGQVTRLHPRSREVTVRYEDSMDIARTTGEPKRKTARAHVLAIDLLRKDG